ncbi:transporter substrate-binding domain-containing protein [Skermanella rosea]|uniref:substrate-binding periplasmic protein n=1 Tax=Skermanella rosea TaxID=1817965 RepID=UPI001E45506F|nr:transporter substrate-binding domain-containing protein [Skermanella rosea]UEM02722.1 transporter substrate-binding domain-containing protein [Skermanella rosea]
MINTLEWCPYVCADAADGGFNTVIVRDAFQAMGYTLQYEILPWQCAVAQAKDSDTVAGYFPEYPAEIEGFTLSDSIGESPLGLIMPAGAKVPEVTPAGLAKLKLGVVSGYVNAAPVREAVEKHGLKTEGVVDDVINIRKVAAGRIDAAEIDRYVFAHLLRTEKQLAPLRTQVDYAATMEIKTLHIAFNNGPYGRRIAEIFAEGLKRIDVKALQSRYFAQAPTTGTVAR